MTNTSLRHPRIERTHFFAAVLASAVALVPMGEAYGGVIITDGYSDCSRNPCPPGIVLNSPEAALAAAKKRGTFDAEGNPDLDNYPDLVPGCGSFGGVPRFGIMLLMLPLVAIRRRRR